ncbi:MAG: cobaltochelatase subunit CobN [Pseudomonadota bacterium]
MHLLQAQAGAIADGIEPVDPGQTPADIVFISANDAEIAALADAHARLSAEQGDTVPGLRLTRLSWLAHPFSVDRFLEETATKARLVIARVLGGEGYWPYGLEQCAARLGTAGVAFCALPGDDREDVALARVSTVEAELRLALWAYLTEGGPTNAAGFLRLAAHLLNGTALPPAAVPLLRAGAYRPGLGAVDPSAITAAGRPGGAEARPRAAVVFYRALLQGAGLQPVDALVTALEAEGMDVLPVYVASLKDPVSAATLGRLFEAHPPDVVLNTTSFAVASPDGGDGGATRTVLDAPDRPVLQVVFAGSDLEAWRDGTRGLSARDIAMNVALPEVDGRLMTRAVSVKGELRHDAAVECPIIGYRPIADRITFTARLAAAWARLGRTPRRDRRVALILANYPNRDGRLANGVGLDTPASTVGVLKALAEAGYTATDLPADSASLMRRLGDGPTNDLADRSTRRGGETLSLTDYAAFFATLPAAVREAVTDRWGAPADDPFVQDGAFRLAFHRFGNLTVGIQPARGYNIDAEATCHDPALPPPHGYIAFYAWARRAFGAHALVHIGKHGTAEWLPGKAVALSEECFPEAVLGPVPHLYPFIVNDPGEGTQAKRRAQAVIVDHLTPPLTRAGSYGPLAELEALVDEYFQASGVDPRRLDHLRAEILSLTASTGLDRDAGLNDGDDADSRLAQLDAYLCELKESQIRDGLHVFGQSPAGRLQTDLIAALARLPRGRGPSGGGRGGGSAADPADASLIRALAADLALGRDFDPLDCPMAEHWSGPRPGALARADTMPWRTMGDTVERLEALAVELIEGRTMPPGPASTVVMATVEGRLRPALQACGPAEMAALIAGLDGRFVAPGPSGAPTRGRPDVLPTGRNFYSVDSRAVPTPAAYALGWQSAEQLIQRHLQDQGEWLQAVALTAWGTANMRTGGDDIAQALALMGVRPTWDNASRRVTGFEILPLDHLARPRVDVTLRVSGFFRDAFPAQMDLVDSAARAVMALDEPAEQNPAAARFRAERIRLAASAAADPEREAGYRVFGARPGAYGAGLQAMIDERLWERRGDLAEAFLDWGGYAYGGAAHGSPARARLADRLSLVDAVVQNQDNREHDLLDSDDYYQFEGGMAATVEALTGRMPSSYHNDHSRPERPVIRTLIEEMGRVVRARVVNPKWIAGCKRHGYKGAFEMAATVDYLFAFAATTNAVADHHFDLVHAAYLEDEETREFLAEANPAALSEIASRLSEALDRGLWTPRSNSVHARLEALAC